MRRLMAILMVLLLMTACGQAEVVESPTPASAPEEKEEVSVMEVKTVEKEAAMESKEMTEVVTASPSKDDGLQGLERLEIITDTMDDLLTEVDRIIEDEEEMALLGDSMFIGMIGMKLLDVQLDYAMKMTDTWEVLDDEMPNGRGYSDSVMTLENGIYIYDYANKWDMDYEDRSHLTFDPSAMTVDYRHQGGNPNNGGDIHHQYIMDDQGALLIAVSEYSVGRGNVDLMVLYYDGTVVNYARQTVPGEGLVELGQDLLDGSVTSWEAMKAMQTFDTVFEYDGNNLSYQHP